MGAFFALRTRPEQLRFRPAEAQHLQARVAAADADSDMLLTRLQLRSGAWQGPCTREVHAPACRYSSACPSSWCAACFQHTTLHSRAPAGACAQVCCWQAASAVLGNPPARSGSQLVGPGSGPPCMSSTSSSSPAVPILRLVNLRGHAFDAVNAATALHRVATYRPDRLASVWSPLAGFRCCGE